MYVQEQPEPSMSERYPKEKLAQCSVVVGYIIYSVVYLPSTRVCHFAKSPKVHGYCEFSHSFGPKDFTK